ncbi:MAG: hypothetical protein MR704_00160 [Clostridia bacterium]|nr:hypothetical protein [Clostridia bacterium]
MLGHTDRTYTELYAAIASDEVLDAGKPNLSTPEVFDTANTGSYNYWGEVDVL